MTSGQHSDTDVSSEPRAEPGGWAAPLGTVVVLVIFASIAFVAVGGWQSFTAFLSGPAANWLQAVAAAVAIVAAYRMGHNQIAANRIQERERQRDEKLRRLKTIDALFVNAFAACSTFKRQWQKQGKRALADFRREIWGDARSALARVDPMDCPSPEVVIYLIQAPRMLDELAAVHADLAFRSRGPMVVFERPPRPTAGKSESDVITELETNLEQVMTYLVKARDQVAKAIESVKIS